MKILLVSAPLEFPLAVYCLAAQLSATPATAASQISILTLDASRLNEYNRKSSEIWRYVAQLEEVRPDLVAFSVYLWSHICTRELIAITHRLYPEAAMIVGGPELATPDAAESFLSGGEVAAAIRGEGEITLVELVGRLAAGETPAGVQGCSWYDHGAVVHEAPRPPLGDLSRLVSPFLTGWVPADLFDRLSPARRGTFPRALLETYRGCYMECSYCQWGNGSKWRFEFPQERVNAELSWILANRISSLWIVDAMFGYKKRRAKEILRHIIEEKSRHGSHTSIVCYHNQDFFDPELFDLYREAGVSVEVDLQSANLEVLTQVGRAKWFTDSFDRHLTAFRDHGVPTTGSADLILGLPRDCLATFSESVDFLLTRGLGVKLYQTAMIPNTPMSRTAAADGAVFSSIAPRAVFKNQTFPVGEMVAARLIGHGLDFFSRYPRTAHLLWQRGFSRPVDLCRRFGDLVWERYQVMYGDSHTQGAALADDQGLVGALLGELCHEAWLLPVAQDLFRLEAAFARLARPPDQVSSASSAARTCLSADPGAWLTARPRYRREQIEEVRLQHRVDLAFHAWEPSRGPAPSEDFWRALARDREPMIALVYPQSAGRGGFSMVDEAVTYQLLLRLSGFFSVAQCLENFSSSGDQRQLADLFAMLSSLALAGVVDTGAVASGQESAAAATNPRHLARLAN